VLKSCCTTLSNDVPVAPEHANLAQGVIVFSISRYFAEACCTLFKQSTDADVRHCLTCNDREAG